MIISEKQIIQLMEYVRLISLNDQEDSEIRWNAATLISQINKQQSEKLKVIE
jgi:hypothetical protein